MATYHKDLELGLSGLDTDIVQEPVHLISTDTLLTISNKDSYSILSGRVRVFIACLDASGRRGNLVFLGIFSAGESIPSFFLCDEDENGDVRQWVFLLETPAEADLMWNQGGRTRPLIRHFVHGLAETRLEQYYQNEGLNLELAIIQLYEREHIKEVSFIFVSDKSTETEKSTAYGILGHVLKEDQPIEGEDPLYRAIVYACRFGKISIKGYEQLRTICGGAMNTVNVAQACQFACRRVELEANWYKSDSGLLIGENNGEPIALIPKGTGKYLMYNGKTEETVSVTKAHAESISSTAYAISRTLPNKELKKRDLILFGASSLSKPDLLMVSILAVVGVFIGILLPTLNHIIYDDYIPLGSEHQLIQICIIIASFMVGSLFFDMVKRLSQYRISSHISIDMATAFYYRIFQLQEKFYRNYDSADLGMRLQYISVFCDKYTNLIVASGIATVCSLLYLYRMFKYSAKMTWFAMLMFLVYVMILWVIRSRKLHLERFIEEKKGESSSKLYQFIGGIEKIRLAGVEDKVVNEYLKPFAAQQNAEIKSDRLTAMDTALSAVITTLFSMLFYLVIVKSKLNISTGNFMAFSSAFGAFSATLVQTTKGLLGVYELRPIFERFRPIMEEVPENDGVGGADERLSGKIELSHVSFSYDGTNTVLNEINYIIEPGSYIGIVGTSGCGKSTLVKLLLGFEKPDHGHIYYDNKDLSSLDKRALRKQLGVVLQNGKLISGSIFENITITAPHATAADVQKVIEEVGLKDDISQMPMGIDTVISEDAGTISGGQLQRILIARALISNPSILIFDEATSALDNWTQEAVCKSLEARNITRIAVAHRLSTIMNCDEIIVLDNGMIVQSGTFDSLMSNKDGLFYKLASRQIS